MLQFMTINQEFIAGLIASIKKCNCGGSSIPSGGGSLLNGNCRMSVSLFLISNSTELELQSYRNVQLFLSLFVMRL